MTVMCACVRDQCVLVWFSNVTPDSELRIVINKIGLLS